MAKNLIVLAIIVAGCWQFGSGSYIYIKAQLAQYLLNNAWSKTLQGETELSHGNGLIPILLQKLHLTTARKITSCLQAERVALWHLLQDMLAQPLYQAMEEIV
jgi:hypothetical protein